MGGKRGTFSFINWANNWLKRMSSERETFFSGQWRKHSTSGRDYKKRLLIGKNTLGNKVDDTTGSEVV